MADSIRLEIVTAAAPTIQVSIKQLYIPAFLGKVGVLENHKPYITLLKPGEVFYTDIQDENFYLYIKDGFMEVNENKIVIISDTVEKGEEFNKDEIENQLADINERIKGSLKLTEGMSEEEIKRMPEDLAKALAEKTELETKLKIVQKADGLRHRK